MSNENFNHIPDIINKAKKLNEQGEQSVPLEKYFPIEFMKKHTKYTDIYLFFEAGGFDANDMDNIDQDELDIFIKKNSDIEDWNEFMGEAGEDYAFKQLGF